MQKEPVTFVASFPTLQSALKVSGDGTGMRITLDIPESEMPQAVKLMLYRQCALRVTIEQYEQETKINTAASNGDANRDRPVKRSTAKRRE